jgi:flagellar basal-body rod modification protein FlgD
MVDGVTAATTSGSTTKKSAATLASNFDQFLSLLTTQLKNQSPLDPLDTNQFTQQLVQFSGVEQQLKTNELIEALIANQQSSAVSTAAAFIGQKVTADSAAAPLKDGKAEWSLSFPRGASGATVEVKDVNGAVVYTEKRSFSAGSQSFTWNGITTSGAAAAAGAYQISIKANDSAGGNIDVKSQVVGVVDGVDLSNGETVLKIGGVSVPIGSVKAISKL